MGPLKPLHFEQRQKELMNAKLSKAVCSVFEATRMTVRKGSFSATCQPI
jgi:hypothetical protein